MPFETPTLIAAISSDPITAKIAALGGDIAELTKQLQSCAPIYQPEHVKEIIGLRNELSLLTQEIRNDSQKQGITQDAEHF